MTLPPGLDPTTDQVAATALADVQFFCEQRFGIVRSPDFTEAVLGAYDQRLAASLDALLTRGPQIVPWLLSILTTAETPGDICGIGVALLESRDPQAAEGLLAALETADEEPKQRGLLAALRRGPINTLVPKLQKWVAAGNPKQAAHAAVVLAFHRRLEPGLARLTSLCSDADPLVRRAAWRATALLPARGAESR
jgi:hypothetical protein